MPITGILLIYLQLYTRQKNNIVHVEKKINKYKVKVKLKVLYH